MKNKYYAAIALAAASSAFVFTAPTITSAQFHDVEPSSPQALAIENLINLQITTGVSATEFAPQKTVTRAEAATFLVKALQLNSSTSLATNFTDIQNHWASQNIAKIVELGIMNGYNETSFGPDDVLTRGQMAKILSIAFNLESKGTANPFRDVPKGSMFESYIMGVYDYGITTGTSPNTYDPDSSVTREQMALFLTRTPIVKERIEQYNETTGVHNKPYDFPTITLDQLDQLLKDNHVDFYSPDFSSNGMIVDDSGMTTGVNGLEQPGSKEFSVTLPGIYYLGMFDNNFINSWKSVRIDSTNMNNQKISFIDQEVVDDIIRRNPTLDEYTKRADALQKAAGTNRSIIYVQNEEVLSNIALISSPSRHVVFEFFTAEPLEFVVTGKFESYYKNSEYVVMKSNSKTNHFSFDMDVYVPAIHLNESPINDYGFDRMEVVHGDASLFKVAKSEYYLTPIYALEGATIEEGTTIRIYLNMTSTIELEDGTTKEEQAFLDYVYINGQFEVVDEETSNV